MFNNSPLNVQYTGNMGDVIKVDLAELAAIKLLTEELSKAASALTTEQIDARKLLLKGFSLSVDVLKEFGLTAQRSGEATAPRLLIATQGAAGSLAPMKDTAAEAFLETGVLYLLPNITNSRLPASSILDARDAQANRFSDIERLRMGQALADKFLSFGYGFTYGKYGEGKPEFNRSGQAAVTARDYATAPATFFGDRPLNNPGYSELKLKNAVNKDLGSIDRLDMLKIEQRLKYLGYGASAIKGNGEIKVNGEFDEAEKIVLRQFSQIVAGNTIYADTEEKIDPKKKKKTNTALPAYKFSAPDVNWLNAYNAPHWMQYNGDLKKKLTGWEDKSNGGMATSWVFDLMLASQKAFDDQKRSPMLFAGAGSLGTQLNLRINEKYISTDNQKRVDARDKVLGIVPLTADSRIPNAQAYTANQWNLANAKALIAKLKNPTTKAKADDAESNLSGKNLQNEALLDFLNVFGVTQSKESDANNPNGYWDGIALQNQSANDAIKRALFGDGTQPNGLIDSKNVLIGGNSNYLGDALTIELLGAYMDTTVNASWLSPLKNVMAKFNITTPSRIAAFLGQIYAETGGFSAIRENLAGYRLSFLLAAPGTGMQNVFYANKPNQADQNANPNMVGDRVAEINFATGLVSYQMAADGVTPLRDAAGNLIPRSMITITRMHAAFLNLKAWLPSIGINQLSNVNFDSARQVAVRVGAVDFTGSISFSTVEQQTAYANRYLSEDV